MQKRTKESNTQQLRKNTHGCCPFASIMVYIKHSLNTAGMGMPYWGQAMCYNHPLWGEPRAIAFGALGTIVAW